MVTGGHRERCDRTRTPPSPMAPAMFQDALDQARTRIDELPIPAFEALLPDSGSVPTGGFDVTRQAIRMRISDLLNCVSEISDARSAINYFSTLESALKNQSEMLDVLAEEMWALAEKYPVKAIVEALLFSAINVKGSYIPFVSETQGKVQGKRKAATTALATRLVEVRGAANEIKNILAVEAIDLRNALEHLEQLDAEVLKLREAVAKIIHDRDESVANVKRQKDLRDGAEMDVAETKERLTTAQQHVADLKDKIKQVTAEIGVPYSCPVSHVPWNQCNDENHVKYKNAYLENQQRLRDDLTRLGTVLKNAEELVVGVSNDLAYTSQILVDYESKLHNASTLLNIVETRLMDAQANLEAKALFTWEEKHRLRADIFASENMSDQSQVQNVIGQLGVAP